VSRGLLGLMIGVVVGIAAAVGLHAVFSTWPELATGWPGRAAAVVSRPGVRLGEALLGRPFHQELGIAAHWLSLQVTVVAGGGLLGWLYGQWPRRPAHGGDPGERAG
jgi:hypothetical protein